MDETISEQRIEDNNNILLLLKQCLVLLDNYYNCVTVMSNNCKCDENIGYKPLFNDLLAKYKTITNDNKNIIKSVIKTSEYNYKFLHLCESDLSEDINKDNENIINESNERNIEENISLNCSENNGNIDLIDDNVTRDNQTINEINIEENVYTINEKIDENFEYISQNYLINNNIDSIITNNETETAKSKVEINESKISIKCYICDLEFSEKSDFWAHNKEHKSKPPFNCEKLINGKVCGRVYTYLKDLNGHNKKVHCNKFASIKRQYRRNESGKLFKCTECGEEYKVLASLHSHRKNAHLQHSYVCDWNGCDYSVKEKWRLNVHRKRHLNIKPFHCLWPGCDSSFVTKSALDWHSIRHSDRKVCCPHCNKLFKARQYLKQHILIMHTNHTPFVCSQCPKKYATKPQLSNHLKSHFVEKIQCDKCDYKTNYKTRLDSHNRRVHLCEKTYRCEVKGCEHKSFFVKKELLAHQMSVHSDERQFVCDWPECGAAFKLKGNLTVHVKCHTGENKQRKRKKFKRKYC